MAEEQEQLSEEVKRRIVIELARFRTTGEIAKILAEEYGVTHVDKRNLHRYDATKDYCVCGAPLKDLFHKMRKEFVEGTNDLYLRHSSYRLRRLQQLSEKAETQGNIRLAASLLEQAAKEVGGLYTNTRRLEGDMIHRHMTVDEARERLAAFQERQRAAMKDATTMQ